MPDGRIVDTSDQSMQSPTKRRVEPSAHTGNVVSVPQEAEDVAYQMRQWENAAKKLAEIAARATTRTSTLNTVITELTGPTVR